MLGLGAKAQIFPPSLHILGPRPKHKERLTFKCHLIFTHGFSMQKSHSSMQASPQSLFFLLSLSLSLLVSAEDNQHTHTSHKILSKILSRSSLLPLSKDLEIQRLSKGIFASKSSPKVRLCIDLWFKFFCYQNPPLIYTKIVIQHPQTISNSRSSPKGAKAKNTSFFLPFSLQKPNQHPKVRFIPLFSVFKSFCGGEYK